MKVTKLIRRAGNYLFLSDCVRAASPDTSLTGLNKLSFSHDPKINKLVTDNMIRRITNTSFSKSDIRTILSFETSVLLEIEKHKSSITYQITAGGPYEHADYWYPSISLSAFLCLKKAGARPDGEALLDALSNLHEHKEILEFFPISQDRKQIRRVMKELLDELCNIDPVLSAAARKLFDKHTNFNHNLNLQAGDGDINFDDIFLNGKPKDSKAWNKFGRLLAEANSYKAHVAFKIALEIDPTYLSAMMNLADNLNSRDALDTLEKALTIYPKVSHLWKRKGIAHNKLEEYDKAIAAFEKALELDPKDEISLHFLALSLIKESASKKLWLEIPCHIGDWLKDGLALGRNGFIKEAIVVFDKAIQYIEGEKHPFGFSRDEACRIFSNKAIALREQGSFKEAIAAFNKALEFKPQKAEEIFILGYKGITLKRMGRFEEAEKCFKEARTLKKVAEEEARAKSLAQKKAATNAILKDHLKIPK